MGDNLRIDRRTRAIIHNIALGWEPTLDGDGAVDVEDVEQDLLFRCWGYSRMHETPPSPNLIRDWARAAMRSYGYAGDNNKFLKSKLPSLTPSQLVEYVGDSVSPQDTVTANDEDFLDYLYFHYGMQREREHELAMREEHARLFWDLVGDKPTIAGRLDDIQATKTGFEWTSLARAWGMDSRKIAQHYVEGELREEVEQIDGGGAVYHLASAIGRQARRPDHYANEFDSGKKRRQAKIPS